MTLIFLGQHIIHVFYPDKNGLYYIKGIRMACVVLATHGQPLTVSGYTQLLSKWVFEGQNVSISYGYGKHHAFSGIVLLHFDN